MLYSLVVAVVFCSNLDDDEACVPSRRFMFYEGAIAPSFV